MKKSLRIALYLWDKWDQRDFYLASALLVPYCLFFSGVTHSQHLRIYACAIANDSTGASMGGSSNGSGLYQSDDTGKSWKHLGWDNIKCYSMDMVQSSNGSILYEATGLGILRSTDYGVHWKQITDWRIAEAMDVAVNQKNPNEIYIATAHGPWRSEDGGESWNSFQIPGRNIYFHHVQYDTSGRILFAGEHLYQFFPIDSSWQQLPFEPDGPNMYPGNAGPKPLWCISKITESHGGDGDINIWNLIITGGPYGAHSSFRLITGGDEISEYNGKDIPIRNVASCLAILQSPLSQKYTALYGTLSDGLFINDEKSQNLPHRQIWTLKSFLVAP